jgi:hypothetical protein
VTQNPFSSETAVIRVPLTLRNRLLIGVGMNVHKLTDLFAERAGVGFTSL